jgi:hypothetical protein
MVDITLIRMGAIESKLSKAKPSFTVPSGRQAAHGIMEDLGKHYVTHGYMTQNYLDWLTNHLFHHFGSLASEEQLYEGIDYATTKVQ